jgi:catechol 2,3-dioxygenase-like lactoylglutathione lyase family enzyme
MSPALNLTRIVSVMLGVRDLEASTRFYTETLGLKATLQSPQIVLLDAGSISLGLSPGHARLAPQNLAQQINGATEVAFAVEDIHASYAALKERGVIFMNAPQRVSSQSSVPKPVRNPATSVMDRFQQLWVYY